MNEVPDSIGARTSRGFNMQVWSGKAFYPGDPREEDICINDIAQALSLQCRFNGHCREFYSVAQHSVICSKIVPPGFELEALLHDAAEAYVGDLIRPVKASFPEYVKFEKAIDIVIRRKFGLPIEITPPIKWADNKVVWTEKRDVLSTSIDVDWGPPIPPLEDRIVPACPAEARRMFLARFYEFTEKR